MRGKNHQKRGSIRERCLKLLIILGGRLIRELSVTSCNFFPGGSLLILRSVDVEIGNILIAEVILAEEDAAHGINLAVEHIILPQGIEDDISLADVVISEFREICALGRARDDSLDLIAGHTEREREGCDGRFDGIVDAVLEEHSDAILNLLRILKGDFRPSKESHSAVGKVFITIASDGDLGRP